MSVTVKDILKGRRLELELTLEDVAKRVGVSPATISRWESGDIANMRRDRIAALAKALQISPAVIMGWDVDTPIPPGAHRPQFKKVPMLGYAAAGQPLEDLNQDAPYYDVDNKYDVDLHYRPWRQYDQCGDKRRRYCFHKIYARSPEW